MPLLGLLLLFSNNSSDAFKFFLSPIKDFLIKFYTQVYLLNVLCYNVPAPLPYANVYGKFLYRIV